MAFAILALTVLSVLQKAASLASSVALNEPVAAAWYAGWHATEGFPLSAVSWDKYNTLIYSFAITTPSVYSLSLNGSDPPLLPEFVAEAHANGVAAHVAIGGWGGGLWFSSDVATSENRTAFVQTVADFAVQYELDGINFDWEYPNEQGIGCNTISPNDTQNFLYFLQELRADPVGARLTLSAATSIVPFRDASGNPSIDVSGFAEVLDYIAIMNYDVWGSWSPAVGPNSPLNDTCAPPDYQDGSAVSAIKAWTAAGIPVNQIVLGVASYGHSLASRLTTRSSTALALNSLHIQCSMLQINPSVTYGMTLVALMLAGCTKAPVKETQHQVSTTVTTHAVKPLPYVYNETSEVMVSFDNAQSFAVKGSYIKETGIRGFAMWEAGGDYHDILLDSIRYTAGFDW
ncbi:glycoside hydrolase family 18 protein [Chiua virens]|nr:glycoside hydrolase family 18 protein [Chiua virens]